MSYSGLKRKKILGTTECVDCGRGLYIGDGCRCNTCMVRDWKKRHPERAKFLKKKHAKIWRDGRKKKEAIARAEVLADAPKEAKTCHCGAPLTFTQFASNAEYCSGCRQHAKVKRRIGSWIKAMDFVNVGHPLRWTVHSIKNRCRRANIPFSMSVDDLELPAKCPVLGITLVYDKPSHYRKYGGSPMVAMESFPSIDRVIPELGYVSGNVRVISMRANRIKNDGTLEEHKKIVRYIADHISLQK